MNDLALTNHAVTRMAQRAILPSDLEIILAFGSEVEDGILVRQKDVECAENAIREILKRLQKLRGKRLVVSEGHLVTAYHATSREQHRLMRSRH
jgi:hypothetical protein